MLRTILLVLLVMWALGLGFGIAGSLLHVLLVVAVVVLVLQFFQGRRPVQRSTDALGVVRLIKKKTAEAAYQSMFKTNL